MIKIVCGALDEEEGDIILRGRLDPSSFDKILVDDYQREILPDSHIDDIIAAFKDGTVPDIILGMRGQRFISQKDDTFVLQDPTYVVDGLQRLTACRRIMKCIMQGDPLKIPRLGCSVHFGTTQAWERDRFIILNTKPKKVSTNHVLRNLAPTNTAVAALYSLTSSDVAFVMRDKVCWKQYMKRSEILSANTLARVTAKLHNHVVARGNNRASDLALQLQKIVDTIGRNVFRNNVKTFWNVINDVWGIRDSLYREKYPWLTLGFLEAFATVLSDHSEFWTDSALFVTAPIKRKLKTFPMKDPSFLDAVRGGARGRFVGRYIIDHLNKGRRTHRFHHRYDAPELPAETETVQ